MKPSPVRTVLWRNPHDESTELCRLTDSPEGFVLEGLVLVAVADDPARVDYRVDVDRRWKTRRARLRIDSETWGRELLLMCDDSGRWLLDGKPQEQLDGCTDVDLRVTAATNTVAIRRLAPAVGEVVEVRAAWVGFPELEVVPSIQSYERLSETEYRYRSGTFVSDLVVDDAGLVLRYGDAFWTALAHSAGR